MEPSPSTGSPKADSKEGEFSGSAMEYARSAVLAVMDKVTLKQRLEKTPLHIIMEKDMENISVEDIFKYRHFLNVQDVTGRTPLHIAMDMNATYHRRQHYAMKLLIDLTDVNIQDNEGKTPLHIAAGNSYIDPILMHELIGLTDVDIKDNEGRTPLHIAVEISNSAAFQMLKDKANLNLQDSLGRTPIHIAVEASNTEAFEVLKDKADLNIKNRYGGTLLHTAVRYSNSKALEVLIDKIDLSLPDQRGRTPLHTAVDYSNAKAFEMLIDKVNLNPCDKDGETPLHIAAKGYKRYAVYANKSIESVKRYINDITENLNFAVLLLKSRAQLDLKDAKGATALDVLLSGIGEMKLLPDERRDHVILLLKAVIWREEYGYIPRIASAVVLEDKEDVFKTILDYAVSENMLRDRASSIHNTDIKEGFKEKDSFIQSCLALSSVATY